MLNWLLRRFAWHSRPAPPDRIPIPPPGLEYLAQQDGDAFIERHHRDWREVSPEECAARRSHNIVVYSAHFFHYRDPEKARWARRLGEILDSAEEVERCRRMHLSSEEYTRVARLLESNGRLC